VRIHPEAIKCKHCGEILDDDRRRRKAKKSHWLLWVWLILTAPVAGGCLIGVVANSLQSPPPRKDPNAPLIDDERIKRMHEESQAIGDYLDRQEEIRRADAWDRMHDRKPGK
jgi:hypothetical protein